MRSGPRGHGESGSSLPELMIAMVVIGIAMAMALMIVTTVTKVTASDLSSGHTASRAEVAVSGIEPWLRGASTPSMAAQAAATSVTASSPCWGTTAAVGGTSWADTSSTASRNPQGVSVIAAQDFFAEYCAYGPAHVRPHVFEATIDPTSCRTSNGFGYCSLVVQDLGLDGTSTPSTVFSLPNVWCDQYCQGSVAGVAPQSNACVNITSTPLPSCSGATPPIFQYFSGAGPWTVADLTPSNVVTNPPTNYDGTLPSIDGIRVNLTLLATGNPGAGAPRGSPGTSVSDQIALESLLS